LERIAHRGAKRELPENSIAAFRRSFERGADAIELDVHATSDGVVVVHHDPTIDRATRTAGRAISGMTWDELRQVELAPGVGVPSLADVLAGTPPTKTVYVEIKGDGIEVAVIGVIRAAAVPCAVHSFDHQAIARCRELAPEIPRGILFEKAPDDVMLQGLRTYGARDLWPRWDLIDAPLVAEAHDAGARVIAWTVNSVRSARSLADMGVDGLCTDDVRLLDGLG
jgi:glycerophosphoryl diester phosphodiesterase